MHIEMLLCSILLATNDVQLRAELEMESFNFVTLDGYSSLYILQGIQNPINF